MFVLQAWIGLELKHKAYAYVLLSSPKITEVLSFRNAHLKLNGWEWRTQAQALNRLTRDPP